MIVLKSILIASVIHIILGQSDIPDVVRTATVVYQILYLENILRKVSPPA